MTSPRLFITQTYDELKKVQWPTRSNVVRLTLIVLIISLVVGLYIGSLDYIFVKLTETIIK